MIDEGKAFIIAVKKILEIFTEDYFKSKKNMPVSHGINDNIYHLFYGFEDKKSRPDLNADWKGWTVFVTVKVDMNTGEAWFDDYILPDGTKKTKVDND